MKKWNLVAGTSTNYMRGKNSKNEQFKMYTHEQSSRIFSKIN